MLKTNSKKAIENIKKYIIENSDFSNFEEYNYIAKMDEENRTGKRNIDMFSVYAHAIYDEFYIEKVLHDKRYEKNMITTGELFIEWCAGLPSILDTCYYYNRSAIEDLGNILEETESERNKYTEKEAEEMLSKLIYRELRKAVEK